ncbi:MAG TPA: glycosyltransferase family 2 protein [Alphaproteobacteria bacterium]|nr:glycosyltransferase family 2 protein [Alphaproteobacteria bacterium]
MSEALAIDICVCTFRRPQIADTLQSLAQLKLRPDWKIHVIIADNDETPNAQTTIEATALKYGLDFQYIHAPARNISIARNACLTAATAPLLAFIDDDEKATPEWLEALITRMNDAHADIVLGPVKAIYGRGVPGWMERGNFHSTKPVWVRYKIITGYSCNVLIRRTHPAFRDLRFHEDLGRSGGEDTVFFSEAHKAGAKIEYAANAVVTEIVASERAEIKWLIRRSFRSGQTHGYLLLLKAHPIFTRIKNVPMATAKSFFCFAMSILNIKPERGLYWLLRGTMHAGVVARLLGVRELQPYGQA